MIGEKVHIRMYENGDKYACIQAFISNVPKYFTEQEITEFETFLDVYENKQIPNPQSQTTFYYVLLHQGKIIACGGFGDRYDDGHLTLTWGLVHQSYHKMGFGKDLLAYRLQAMKMKFKRFELCLDTTQYSFGFFEKFGFVTEKISANFYAKGLDRFDMVLKVNEDE